MSRRHALAVAVAVLLSLAFGCGGGEDGLSAEECVEAPGGWPASEDGEYHHCVFPNWPDD